MNKKVYYGLMIFFIAMFYIGSSLLVRDNTDYDIELWSYYTGGHNVAINTFNQQNEQQIKYVGIAEENFMTKVETVIESKDMPDIIMVDSANLGQLVDQDQFVSFNQIFADDDNYQTYLQNASTYGLQLGQNNSEQKAIKFENSNGVFVYRSDLASLCLGIETPEQMTATLTNSTDLFKMYEQLKTSDNVKCNISLLATTNFTDYFTNPNHVIKNEQVNEQLIEDLKQTKEAIDSQLVYTRFGTYHELIDNSQQANFLGDITTVNQLRAIYDFNQPGKWAIAQAPIKYQGNTPYFLISKDADLEVVKSFFDQTYFNQQWLAANINDLGILENQLVMNAADLTSPNLQVYFTNEDLMVELSNSFELDNVNRNPNSTRFDSGIKNVVTGVMNEYIDGKITEQQIIEKIIEDLNKFYNGAMNL